jgi:hypothetical protein
LVSTPPSYLASTRIRCGPEDRFFWGPSPFSLAPPSKFRDSTSK